MAEKKKKPAYSQEEVRSWNEKLYEPGLVGMAQQYFANHPARAGMANKALGYIGTDLNSAMQFGADAQSAIGGMFSGAGASPPPKQYGLDPQGLPLSANPPQGGVSTIPKNVIPNRGASVRDAVRGALSPAMGAIHKRYGITEDDSDTLIGGFMDSSSGRELGDKLLKNPDMVSDLVHGYDNYVKQWSGKGKQKASVELDDPIIVDASTATPEQLAKAVKDKRPTIVKNASDLGFTSDEIMVHGKSRTKSKPEALADAKKTPVMTEADFIDVVKLMRGG